MQNVIQYLQDYGVKLALPNSQSNLNHRNKLYFIECLPVVPQTLVGQNFLDNFLNSHPGLCSLGLYQKNNLKE